MRSPDFFDGMATAFGMVADWMREDQLPPAQVVEQFAASERQTADLIRQAEQ